MPGMVAQVKLAGLKAVLDSLADLNRTVRNKILRAAINDGSRPILDNMKARAPVGDTGQFRRSLGRRVRTYRQSGVVVVVIGPRKGFRVVTQRGTKLVPHDPAKIAHLLEFGHVIVRGGKAVGHAPPYPTIGPAMEEEKGAATQAIGDRIAAELAKIG
jgi:HK97 gp10 family phage protein